MSIIAIAQALGNRGYAVFPCRENKQPATPHGFKDARKDPDGIAALWSRHSGALIGIATGAASGIDVLDLDAKHDEALAWWHRHRSLIPATWRYRTRSGGLHLWFRHALGVGCTSSRIARGIDTRGDGGYIVYWPLAGFPILDRSFVAPWPAFLAAALRPKRTAQLRASCVHVGPAPDGATAGVLRTVAHAQEGNRNAALYWASCRFAEHAAHGSIRRDDAEPLLVSAAGKAGLPEREARTTIASAWRRITE